MQWSSAWIIMAYIIWHARGYGSKTSLPKHSADKEKFDTYKKIYAFVLKADENYKSHAACGAQLENCAFPALHSSSLRFWARTKLILADRKTIRWKDKHSISKNTTLTEPSILIPLTYIDKYLTVFVLHKQNAMLLAQEAWHRQDGRLKRIYSQVLTVEFAALVWDSSANGSLRKSYMKRKQETATW